MGIEIKIVAENGHDMREQVAHLFASVFGSIPINMTVPVLTEEPIEEEVLHGKRSKRAKGNLEKPAEPVAEEEAGNGPTSSTEETTASSGAASTQTEAGPSGQDNDAPQVAYADVQKAVTQLAAKKGRDAVVKVFDSFGVDHGTKLKPEQWVDAVAELEKAAA